MKNLSGSRRNRVCHIILFLFSASTLFAQQPTKRTILRAGKLLDVKTGKIFANQAVVIEGDKIASITPSSGVKAPAADCQEIFLFVWTKGKSAPVAVGRRSLRGSWRSGRGSRSNRRRSWRWWVCVGRSCRLCTGVRVRLGQIIIVSRVHCDLLADWDCDVLSVHEEEERGCRPDHDTSRHHRPRHSALMAATSFRRRAA